MVFLLILLLAFSPALGESVPSQAGLDAAQALMAMHDAVMADVLEKEAAYPTLAGGDGLYVLYADENNENFLLVSLGETGDSADIAVMQSYTLRGFDEISLSSLTALALPFVPEENLAGFEKWRDETSQKVAEAARRGADMELTYYTGDYIACAMSIFHDDIGPMFTALISFNTPLTANDITLRMEGLETEDISDGKQ